jgi:L-asparagine transporter-like permease
VKPEEIIWRIFFFVITAIIIGLVLMRWSVVHSRNSCFVYSIALIVGGIIAIGTAIWSGISAIIK